MDKKMREKLALHVKAFEQLEEQVEMERRRLHVSLEERATLASTIFSMRTGLWIGTILKVKEKKNGRIREALVWRFDAPYNGNRIQGGVDSWSPNIWVRWRKKNGEWGVDSQQMWAGDVTYEIVGEDMEAVK